MYIRQSKKEIKLHTYISILIKGIKEHLMGGLNMIKDNRKELIKLVKSIEDENILRDVYLFAKRLKDLSELKRLKDLPELQE